MTARKYKPGSLLGNLLGLFGFSAAAGALVAASLAPGVAVAATAANSGMDMFQALPDYATINQQADRNIIYGNRDGEPVEIARIYSQNRQTVELKNVSPNALNAAVAAEDRRFYSHGGADAQSLGRAVMSQLGFGGDSGGSTLTMQLVRQQIIIDAEMRRDQATTDEERAEAQAIIDEQWDDDYNRKLREIKLAMALETLYTKDEILLAYLNVANFGETVYGIEAAAQTIFGVSASQLNPAQAASLIATVQEPVALNLLNPENFQSNQDRRDWILGQMAREGYITEEEHEENLAIPVDEDYVDYSPQPSGCVAGHESARYFCNYVDHVLKQDQVHGQYIFGQSQEASQRVYDQGGFHIYTTIDLDLNDHVQDLVREYAPTGWNGADLGGGVTMLEVDTGRILTMVQNKEYDPTDSADEYSTGINYNTTRDYGGSTGFQPGSTYKIFTLAEWIQQGYSPNERLDTNRQPRSITACGSSVGEFDPQNNEGINWGRQSVTDIMVNSVNTGTVEMATRLDLCDIQDLASSMGFVNAADPGAPLELYPSTIIGGADDRTSTLTIAQAFATFANDGVHCEPLAIDRIVDRDGNEVAPPQPSCERVLSSEDNSVVQHVLREVNRRNPNTNPGNAPVISKTGTNDRVGQTWSSGASPNVAASAWIGNVKGHTTLQPIWTNVRDLFRLSMQEANNLYPGGEFTPVDEETLRGNMEEVPDVTGMDVDEAISALEEEGFENVEVADPVEGSNDDGSVEYTAPAAGTSAAPDALVTIFPSDGSMSDDDGDGDGDLQWPSLGGMSLSDARSAVDSAGFNSDNIQVTWHAGSQAQVCQVLAQNPEAGTPADEGDPISVVVGGRSDGSAADC
ncbi:MAG TPA: transglycosylase domain-containing protein [Candidatus Agrococcus pullicola]|uniref:Transglycosylase domain-containing protein n=1 Tax=Candidatus Agrococcus pullicola TaxID=2838429 RepID=A0A9D2C9L2_9MICO|nr:transglycosylase domain-containing protein [Candidatus Agrococcus pullicola]